MAIGTMKGIEEILKRMRRAGLKDRSVRGNRKRSGDNKSDHTPEL